MSQGSPYVPPKAPLAAAEVRRPGLRLVVGVVIGVSASAAALVLVGRVAPSLAGYSLPLLPALGAMMAARYCRPRWIAPSVCVGMVVGLLLITLVRADGAAPDVPGLALLLVVNLLLSMAAGWSSRFLP